MIVGILSKTAGCSLIVCIIFMASETVITIMMMIIIINNSSSSSNNNDNNNNDNNNNNNIIIKTIVLKIQYNDKAIWVQEIMILCKLFPKNNMWK